MDLMAGAMLTLGKVWKGGFCVCLTGKQWLEILLNSSDTVVVCILLLLLLHLIYCSWLCAVSAGFSYT